MFSGSWIKIIIKDKTLEKAEGVIVKEHPINTGNTGNTRQTIRRTRKKIGNCLIRSYSYNGCMVSDFLIFIDKDVYLQ
jgi:hypothetical protein